MTPHYTITEADEHYVSLCVMYASLHEERLITNYSDISIAVIRPDGSSDIIENIRNEHTVHDEHICVKTRKILKTSDNAQKSIKSGAYPTHTVRVDTTAIKRQGSLFVPQLGYLFCLPELLDKVRHPYHCGTSAIIETAVQQQKLQYPHIGYIFSDPASLLNASHLYLVLFNDIIEIPVDTSFYSTDTTPKLIMPIMTQIGAPDQAQASLKPATSMHYEEILMPFIENKNIDYIEMHGKGSLLAVTLDRRKAEEYARIYKGYTTDEYTDAIKRREAQIKLDHEEEKSQLRTKISNLETQMLTAKQDVKEMTDNYERYKRLYDEHVNVRKIALDEAELNVKQHTLNSNMETSHNKVRESARKAEAAEKEAKFKFVHVILAAAIPVVISIIGKLLDWYIRTRTA